MIKLLKADPAWFNELGGTSVDELWIVGDGDVDEMDGYVILTREDEEVHVYWQDRDYSWDNMEDAIRFLNNHGYDIERKGASK